MLKKRQPNVASAKRPGKRKAKEDYCQGEEDLFHDEKNFARFLRDMTNRFPRLGELEPESGGDKNETLNVIKANEVHAAVVEARDEDAPIVNNGTLVFGMITERLKHFPISSARCKKVYDKYFKKSGGENSEKKNETPGLSTSGPGGTPPVRVLKVYEKMHQALENWIDYNCDSMFDQIVESEDEINKNTELAMASNNPEKAKSPTEPETPLHRSTRHKPSIGIPSSNGKDKKKRSEDDLKLTGVPNIDDLARDLKTLVNRIKLNDYVEKLLREERGDFGVQQEPIVTDPTNRFEKDRLTFGEQSPKVIEADIAAPRLEKSISLIGEMVLDKQTSEEKDIPLLRAYSESAMNSAEPPINFGGFSLTKPGFIKTPIKSFEKRSEETFGRKDSITRAFNQFHMKSSEKKMPMQTEDHSNDIELAAKILERALEGQL